MPSNERFWVWFWINIVFIWSTWKFYFIILVAFIDLLLHIEIAQVQMFALPMLTEATFRASLILWSHIKHLYKHSKIFYLGLSYFFKAKSERINNFFWLTHRSSFWAIWCYCSRSCGIDTVHRPSDRADWMRSFAGSAQYCGISKISEKLGLYLPFDIKDKIFLINVM